MTLPPCIAELSAPVISGMPVIGTPVCLQDPELNHPLSHPDQHPQHVERLAAYRAEVTGGATPLLAVVR